jgi:hypothetical protein
MSEDRDEHRLRPMQIALVVVGDLGVVAITVAWIILKVIEASVAEGMSGLD